VSQRSIAEGGPRSVPRRWNETLDGIRWLPRLIDKARMERSGRLGAYLFGHSPFDAALLRRMRVTTDEFAKIVDASPDDQSVLLALRAKGFDEARVRRWSDRLPTSARLYTSIWDADDGYTSLNPFGRALLAIWRGVERPIMALVRAIRKVP
jgi:hypothetical protein